MKKKGASFNEVIEEALLDVQIEDLWIPYLCITTDISASKMRVHTTGKEKLSSFLFCSKHQTKKDVCCCMN
jgi:predicted acylesterase/phospholipase RssA